MNARAISRTGAVGLLATGLLASAGLAQQGGLGERLGQVGKGEGHSSPSPLSQEGQFPPFTGEPLSGTGRPHDACPLRGGYSVSYTEADRNSVKKHRPRRRKLTSRNRPLSARLLRLYFIHRRRMRIQRSKPRKQLPTWENEVAK